MKPSRETKIFLKQVSDAFANDEETQKQLKEFILQESEYKDRIKRQEYGLAQIKENTDGSFEDLDGNPVSEEYKNTVNEFVDKRMLTESPELRKSNIEYRGGSIVPDTTYYLREVEKIGSDVARRNRFSN